MRPRRFRPWAEEQISRSEAVASVAAVQDDRPGHDYLMYTHVTFVTGAKVIITWVGTAPPGGDPTGQPETIVTGEIARPREVPPLATSGRLKLLDIEAHLAAMLHNGGHEEIAEVVAFHDRPDPIRDQRTMQYGIHVGCHSGASVIGLMIHTLPRGQQPTERNMYKQLVEL